jgi:hypothetical protein
LRDRSSRESDPWFASILLSAIALTRQDEALEFLIDQVRADSPRSEAAIEAILRAAPSDEVIMRLKDLVAGNPRLAQAFAAHHSRTK